MSLFLISALRAILEMLGLCLAGQGVLYLIAGRQRSGNQIYKLFALITSAPLRIIAALLPRSASALLIGGVTFVVVLILWLALAFLRKFV